MANNWKTSAETRQRTQLPYKTSGKMTAQIFKTKVLNHIYNLVPPYVGMPVHLVLMKLIGIKTGKGMCFFDLPFHCTYGNHITVGDNFYANMNCTILDNAEVTIGDNAFIAPNVTMYTAGHPLHPAARNTNLEYALPITIGDNVWVGGNSVICPGVTIGNNVVIGAGSVVNKDIPDNVLAVGNPCHVIRSITEDDLQYYYKHQTFDDETMPLVTAEHDRWLTRESAKGRKH